MDLGDVDDLVVGLVAGSVIDQVRGKARAILTALALVGVLAIVGLVAAPTWGKVLCALILVVAAVGALFTLAARRAVVALLDRGIDRTDLASRPVVHRWREDFEDRSALEDPALAQDRWEELMERYRMVEVKGPGDRLQDNQLRWLQFCREREMPVAVCYVRWHVDD